MYSRLRVHLHPRDPTQESTVPLMPNGKTPPSFVDRCEKHPFSNGPTRSTSDSYDRPFLVLPYEPVFSLCRLLNVHPVRPPTTKSRGRTRSTREIGSTPVQLMGRGTLFSSRTSNTTVKKGTIDRLGKRDLTSIFRWRNTLLRCICPVPTLLLPVHEVTQGSSL